MNKLVRKYKRDFIRIDILLSFFLFLDKELHNSVNDNLPNRLIIDESDPKNIEIKMMIFRCKNCTELNHSQVFYLESESPVSKDVENCASCSSKANSAIIFMKQIKNNLNIQENLQCDVCGKVFQKSDQFHKHVLNHSKSKDITCSYCGKTFNL